jgi:hypothetical protein
VQTLYVLLERSLRTVHPGPRLAAKPNRRTWTFVFCIGPPMKSGTDFRDCLRTKLVVVSDNVEKCGFERRFPGLCLVTLPGVSRMGWPAGVSFAASLGAASVRGGVLKTGMGFPVC